MLKFNKTFYLKQFILSAILKLYIFILYFYIFNKI